MEETQWGVCVCVRACVHGGWRKPSGGVCVCVCVCVCVRASVRARGMEETQRTENRSFVGLLSYPACLALKPPR